MKSLEITIFSYPNHQFILWDPFGAEVLRIVYNIHIVGSTNTIGIAAVHHPIPYSYNSTTQSILRSTPQPPDFENTINERHFDIFARIGAPPYSIANFMVYLLLLSPPQALDITIIDAMSAQPVLNSVIFQHLYRQLPTLLPHPQHLSQFIHNSSPFISSSLQSARPGVSPPHHDLLSRIAQSPSRPFNPIIPRSIFLSLLLTTPIADLYRDLSIRGLYVTNGSHYNVHLIIYDPLTHYRGYNQAPPTALTGGNSMKTDAHTVTWDERDESNAMYRCFPYSEQHQQSITGFDFQQYLEEKRAMSQIRLDKLKFQHEQLQQLIELKKQQGREKKQQRQQQQQQQQQAKSSNVVASTTYQDTQIPPPSTQETSSHPISTHQTSSPNAPQPTTNTTTTTTTTTIPHSEELPDFDDLDLEPGTQHPKRDDSDNDEDDENIDPLLHVHSRWLVEFIAWNSGQESFTMPYDVNPISADPSLHDFDPIVPSSDQAHHQSDGFLIEAPSTTTTTTTTAAAQYHLQQHQSADSGLIDINTDDTQDHVDVQAWKARNAFHSRMIQLGTQQDIAYLHHLQSHLSTQRSLFQHCTTQPYTEPSIGYPELSISVEEVNGSVRLCDALHKRLVIASTTPPIFHQVQHTFLQSLTTSHPTPHLRPGHSNLCTSIVPPLHHLQQTLLATVRNLDASKQAVLQTHEPDPTQPFSSPLPLSEQPAKSTSSHFTYLTLEFDGPMSVTGVYKRKPVGSDANLSTMYTSPSALKYPEDRPTLLDLEETQLYHF